MSTTRKDKPRSKPRQRSRKTDQRGQKPDQQQNPKLVQRDEDRIGAMVASTDTLTNGAAAPVEPLSGAPAPADAPLIGEIAPADAPQSAQLRQWIPPQASDPWRMPLQSAQSRRRTTVQSVFKLLRMRTRTTPRSPSRRPGPLSKSSWLFGRSIRRLRFRPNSQGRLMQTLSLSRRRFVNSTANLPSRSSSGLGKASRRR